MPSIGSALPPRTDYYVATVSALRQNGGTANIEQIETTVAEMLAIEDAALSIPHGDGRRTQFQYDLAWVRTYLKWAGVVDNRQRGVWTLTPHGQSLSDEQLRTLWRDQVAKQRAAKQLPSPPSQGPGPHFHLEHGVLAFAAAVDASGNDLKRLNSLKPVLEETLSDLGALVEREHGLWPRLERAVVGYADALKGDVARLDFGRLFGQGVLLSHAAKAAREPSTGNAYPLTPEVASVVDSLLDLHSVFLMGSQDGQLLLADAHRFGTTREEAKKLDDSERAVALALTADTAPVAPSVKQHVTDLIQTEDNEKDKARAYRGGLIRNATIVLVSGAVFLLSGGLTGPAGYLALLFGGEALKKSKIGKGISDNAAALIDKSTVDFVADNSRSLTEFAKRTKMDWLSKAVRLVPPSGRLSPPSHSPSPDGSLLLEASEDGRTGALPFSGTFDWGILQSPDGVELSGEAHVPQRSLSCHLTFRINANANFPASHLLELTFSLGDNFPGGSISSVPGILLKSEQLVQGTPLIGASALVGENSFLFTLSAAPEDIEENLRLLTTHVWMDIAMIYATGKRAILTLRIDDAAVTLLGRAAEEQQGREEQLRVPPTPQREP